MRPAISHLLNDLRLDVIAGVTIGSRPADVAWPLNGGWHLALAGEIVAGRTVTS